MKVDGEKNISILLEDDTSKMYIQNSSLNKVVNFIVLQDFVHLQFNEESQKQETKYIIIDNKEYNSNAVISVKLQVSLLETLIDLEYFKHTYNAIIPKIKLNDFYNKIVSFAEEYACDLDTDINNLKIRVMELEIVNKEEE